MAQAPPLQFLQQSKCLSPGAWTRVRGLSARVRPGTGLWLAGLLIRMWMTREGPGWGWEHAGRSHGPQVYGTPPTLLPKLHPD